MPRSETLQFDEIGYWSEVKRQIIKEYASAYSKILSAQRDPALHHVYIDAFAGPGVAISRATKEFVPGSPLNALLVEPPFREYHLIDLNPSKAQNLRDLLGEREDVSIYEGDCNDLLLSDVFPRVRYEDYRRGLCLLDPYGLHLNWNVMRTAGEMRSIDIFLNFPVADINRKVLWREPERVDPADIQRMNAWWGDESWREAAYTTERDLFHLEEKKDNESVAEAFRIRLKKVAKFQHVPKPIAMRNSKGAVVYYLFFASQKPVAKHIVGHIFKKYRHRGA
ncbi:MAG TPA: three-Cys-motif partner protein TcmP [Sumerlaeia bacterium]|nr:three-Cys-motif partner protein TcmP [Sumerlaeia bacterium]